MPVTCRLSILWTWSPVNELEVTLVLSRGGCKKTTHHIQLKQALKLPVRQQYRIISPNGQFSHLIMSLTCCASRPFR